MYLECQWNCKRW